MSVTQEISENQKNSQLLNDFAGENGNSGMSSSIGYIPSDKKFKITLEKSNEMTYFLTKVGLFFAIYHLTWILGIIIKISINMQSGAYSNVWFYIFITFFINMMTLKIILGLFGKYFRRFITYFFIVDCFCIFILTISSNQFFTHLLEKEQTRFAFVKPYLPLLGILGLLNAGGFTLSTTIQRDKGYNPLWGILLMTLTTGLSIGCVPFINDLNSGFGKHGKHTDFRFIHLVIFYSIACLANVYFVLDLWLISKKRKTKFFINDYAFAFYCVGLDWTFRFWIYMCVKSNSKSNGNNVTMDNDSKFNFEDEVEKV